MSKFTKIVISVLITAILFGLLYLFCLIGVKYPKVAFILIGAGFFIWIASLVFKGINDIDNIEEDLDND